MRTAAAVFAGAIPVGLWLTRGGMGTTDTMDCASHAEWLVRKYLTLGGPVPPPHDPIMIWYGPLWDLALGLASRALGFLRDPTWIQHAFTFALLPLTLFLTWTLLRRGGVGRSTALLALAMLLGCIRFGGHSVLNVKDFPAACGCLLAALGTWLHLRAASAMSDRDFFSSKTISGGALIAIVPYLLRPPLLFHFAAWWAAYAALGWRRSSTRPLLARALIGPPIVAIAAIAAAWPTMWTTAPATWLAPLTLFSRFPLQHRVRAFGLWLNSSAMPWWYPVAWLPVILEPVTFLLLVAGLASWLDRRGRGQDLPRLAAWLATLSALPVIAFIARRPAVYDDERQLLFLYPPLLVLAALGLDRLPGKAKAGLAALAAASSLFCYASWGRYSYVYRSPLSPRDGSDSFMGDYWGVCAPELVNALPRLLPPGAAVAMQLPIRIAQIQADRIRRSAWPPVARPLDQSLVDYDSSRSSPDYLAFYGRPTAPDHDAIAARIRQGQARVLYEDRLPTGQLACALLASGPDRR